MLRCYANAGSLDIMTALIVILAAALAATLLIVLRNRRAVAGGPDNPSLSELLALLDAFLQVVGETAWSTHDGRRHLESELDRYRCVHFTFGAIKRLAESAGNHETGNAFAGIASAKEASYWFGEHQAMDVIRRYGVLVNLPDLEVQVPAQAGYSSMQRFLAGDPSDMRDGYTSLKDELRTVIRGYSTANPDPNKDLAFDGSLDRTPDLHQMFGLFLDLLELPHSRVPSYRAPENDYQRRRCFYFILGAGHRIAQTVPTGEESGGEFYRSMASQQAKALFGESQGDREVVLHIEYMADPQQAPAYFLKTLEEGHSAMEQYLNGIEGFSSQTVAGIIRTNFTDTVFGDDTARA